VAISTGSNAESDTLMNSEANDYHRRFFFIDLPKALERALRQTAS
jgi:hypothetical protein